MRGSKRQHHHRNRLETRRPVPLFKVDGVRSTSGAAAQRTEKQRGSLPWDRATHIFRSLVFVRSWPSSRRCPSGGARRRPSLTTPLTSARGKGNLFFFCESLARSPLILYVCGCRRARHLPLAPATSKENMHRDHELFCEFFGSPAGRLKSPLLSTQAEEMPAPAATVRLGALPPYLKTHGRKVARLHMVDWIVLLLLAAVDVGLNLIEPFHRFVGKGMMDTLLYPLKDNTVPVWAVPILAVVLPMVIFTGIYMKRRNTYDLHHAILGLFFSVLITGVLTDAIKDGVGRPRPNFYWRCFPDGVPNYNNITGQVICHGEAAVIKEGHKSFPSGHTSWSFAGLGFLSWYLAGKIRVFDQRGHIAKLCIVIMPLLLAALVGVSRVDDYWHHWQDVFAGGILGLVVASFCYLQFFPSPSGEHGHWPHAYHHHILNPEVESQAQQTGASTSDRHQAVLPRDLSVIHYAVSMEVRTNGRALDSMEAGSRAR